MTAKIYKFPGYLLPDDGVSVIKDGRRWPDVYTLLDSLTDAEQCASSLWTTKRFRTRESVLGHRDKGGVA
jgi:hypothetical protein